MVWDWCARCGSLVDMSAARVGTVVDGDVSSSVLLCADCGDDPETQRWLTHHRADGRDQSERRPSSEERSAAQRVADQARDHLEAAKRRVEDAKRFSGSAQERIGQRRQDPPSEPESSL